jgi:hypothetical protein
MQAGILNSKNFETFPIIQVRHREDRREVLVSDHKHNRCEVAGLDPGALTVQNRVPPPAPIANKSIKSEGGTYVLLPSVIVAIVW